MLSLSSHRVSTVLKTFSKKRIKRFYQYLNSSYPGYPDKSRRLGKYLLTFYPDFESSDLNAHKAYEAIDSDGDFSQHELIRYLSILLTALEDFLAIESLQKSPWLKNFLIAECYFETQDEPGFRKSINKLHGSLEAIDKQDSQHVFYDFLAKKLSFNHLLRQKNIPGALERLHLAHEKFDHYYFDQIFQAAVSERMLQGKAGHNLRLIKPAIEVMEGDASSFPPLTQAWYLTYLLSIKLEDESRYRQLKQVLVMYAHSLPVPDARSIAALLNNSLRRQKGQDQFAYLQERFDTYLLEIEHNWLVVQGALGHNTFINIIIAALALGEIPFAEKFISDYKTYLLANVRASVVHYAQALIAFKKKKYKACLFLCQKVKYFEDTITLGTKRLQLMCHWELKEADQLGVELNTLRVFLFRMKKSKKTLHDRNKDFYKVISLLSKGPLHSIDEKVQKRLRSIIQDNPYLPELEWINSVLI